MLELFTNIYIIPPEIVEGWENSNGPFQVINAIFFPFPFPACQGGSPAPHVGRWEAAGLAKAAAQWGPAASGSSFHPRQLCGTLEGKSPAAAAQLGLGETLSMERGGTGRVLAARRGHSQLRGRRLLWKWFLPPAVSTSSLQWRTELFPLSACFCPAPAVLHPLLRWFGDGSRGGLRSLAPLEGLGWEKLPHSTPGLHTPTQSHA